MEGSTSFEKTDKYNKVKQVLKYSLIECFDPITNEVMYFECITPVSPDELQNISAETIEEVFYVDSLYNLLNGFE